MHGLRDEIAAVVPYVDQGTAPAWREKGNKPDKTQPQHSVELKCGSEDFHNVTPRQVSLGQTVEGEQLRANIPFTT